MKVDWVARGYVVREGKGEDGSTYRIMWFLEETPLGSALTGPPALLTGKYITYKDDQQVSEHATLAEATHLGTKDAGRNCLPMPDSL